MAGTELQHYRKRVVDLTRLWNLERVAPRSVAANGVVVTAEREGQPVVLKVLCPGSRECEALRILAGPTVVELLEVAEDALLMPKLGEELATLDNDQERTRIFLDVLQRLPEVQTDRLPPFSRQVMGGISLVQASTLAKYAGLAQVKMMELERRYPALALHGDLHHHNILRDGQSWRLIDPHGYRGPRLLEAGALCKNPVGFLSHSNWSGLLEMRLSMIAEDLQVPARDLRDAVFCYGFVSGRWSLDDGEPPPENLPCYLDQLLS